jgi:hypothetical protein
MASGKRNGACQGDAFKPDKRPKWSGIQPELHGHAWAPRWICGRAGRAANALPAIVSPSFMWL